MWPLRPLPRISYTELEEPNMDEYIFCTKCGDYVYEYCCIHGPLLVIPDDVVTGDTDFLPRAMLTIPKTFLYIEPSRIPNAGLGVFSCLTLPRDVRFGPYRGIVTYDNPSDYCWQIYKNNRPLHIIDGGDPNNSNWMRYVNCARNWYEQNLVAFQYKGEIYYRTIRTVPRFTELLVFYGNEYAQSLNINSALYSFPVGYANKLGSVIPKKPQLDTKKQNNDNIAPKIYTNAQSNCTTAIDTTESKKAKTVVSEDEPIAKENTQQTITMSTQSKTAKKTFECPTCNYKSVYRNALKLHIKTHTGEKPFNCKVCDKKFTRQQHLMEHIRTHTGEKPFNCKVCDKKFTKKFSLTYHIRTHTGEKPFNCKVCDKKFTQQQHLTGHIRTHTGEKPFNCKVCDKKFTRQQYLTEHIRTHTGEKPFNCKVCDKKFAKQYDLTKHIRTHTGEKPFNCKVCDKKFAWKSNLTSHIKSIHRLNTT